MPIETSFATSTGPVGKASEEWKGRVNVRFVLSDRYITLFHNYGRYLAYISFPEYEEAEMAIEKCFREDFLTFKSRAAEIPVRVLFHGLEFISISLGILASSTSPESIRILID